MRILIAHNYTQQRGGADEAAEQEAALLRQHGHEVAFYTRHNDEVKQFSSLRKGLLFFEPTWSPKTYREASQTIQTFQPDVLHCHSFFPLISPAIYDAAAKQDIPVVQTLHEYRLLCPIGWLFRDNQVCEECIDHSYLRGIWHGCYQDSRAKTASVALMLQIHRMRQTWTKKVHALVTPTKFAQQKIISGGFSHKKVWVHSNFLSQDPGFADHSRSYALYAGRLSPEKGLVPLLQAWKHLPHVPLKIIGNGPLQGWMEDYIAKHQLNQIELLGFRPLSVVLEHLKQALVLLLPSICYETFGRTIMEAYATGTPVIASRLGAMAELVVEGKTGFLAKPNDAEDLAKTVDLAIADRDRLQHLGRQARKLYEQSFTPEIAYRQLMEIYRYVQTR
jgi:glycosyltransferase involved in cell wall biosynthesis